MFLVSSCTCLCPIQWSQVLSRKWRCSWSSADRRCSNYIWVINNFIAHTMDLLWEKFLYMKPISFQSKASVVCSVSAAIFIDFCLTKLNVFSQHIGQKTNEYLNSAEQIPRNWNINQLSVLITSWDITEWCSINLLWKELMKCMSENTGLISSYQFLIIAACTNTGGKIKGSHSRAADWCPFVPRHRLIQVTSFMQLGMLWPTKMWLILEVIWYSVWYHTMSNLNIVSGHAILFLTM